MFLSRRQLRWIAVLGLADILAFALTIHSHLTYHAAPNGPTVMTIGQLLGWIISVALLIIVGLIILGARQAERYRRLEG